MVDCYGPTVFFVEQIESSCVSNVQVKQTWGVRVVEFSKCFDSATIWLIALTRLWKHMQFTIQHNNYDKKIIIKKKMIISIIIMNWHKTIRLCPFRTWTLTNPYKVMPTRGFVSELLEVFVTSVWITWFVCSAVFKVLGCVWSKRCCLWKAVQLLFCLRVCWHSWFLYFTICQISRAKIKRHCFSLPD